MSFKPNPHNAKPLKGILRKKVSREQVGSSDSLDSSPSTKLNLFERRIIFEGLLSASDRFDSVQRVFVQIDGVDMKYDSLNDHAKRKRILDQGKIYKAQGLDAGWRGCTWLVVSSDNAALSSWLDTALTLLRSLTGLSVVFVPSASDQEDDCDSTTFLAASVCKLQILSFRPDCADCGATAKTIAESCSRGYSYQVWSSNESRTALITLHCGITTNVDARMQAVQSYLKRYHQLHVKRESSSSHPKLLLVEYRAGIARFAGGVKRMFGAA